MNKLKRLAALALSLAMVFTMGMGVAAEKPDASKHEAKIGEEGYATLEDAVDEANGSGNVTIELLKDVEIEAKLDITADGVTIDGDGHTLTSTATYAVQFWCCESGSLTDLTIIGGTWYSVLVNNSAVSITDCTLNPTGSAWGGIDFSMSENEGVDDLPKITSLRGTTSSSTLVFIDDGTVNKMATVLEINFEEEPTPAEKANAVLDALKNADIDYLPDAVLESMTVNEDGEIGAPANGSSTNNTYTPSKKRYTELPRNWWPEIEKIRKAAAGETVEIELRGDKVSAQVIDEAAGKDVFLAVNHLGNIYTVNGQDLKSDPARIYYTAADFIKEITAVDHTVTPVED